MTALRAHRRGGPDELVVEQAPLPVPGAGEALVAVHAAATTFDELSWDETCTRNGADRTPTIPSHELSGTVSAIGNDVTDFAVGDEVYGLIPFDRNGAAAEFVSAAAADMALRPKTLSHNVSAAVPLAGLTAWQALVDHARVQPGETVLVLGGVGGVGALTVQLAAAFGAAVTATIRSDDREVVRDFGARHVIDTRTSQFETPDGGYDVVVDTVGGSLLARAMDAMHSGSRLVTLSAPPPQGVAEAHGGDATFFIVTPNKASSRHSLISSIRDDCAFRSQPSFRSAMDVQPSKAATQSGANPGKPF